MQDSIQPGQHVPQATDAYVYELLTEHDARYVEEHCRGCAACQAELQEARARRQALQSLATSDLPDGLIRATQQQIHRHHRGLLRAWWPVPAVIAVTAVALGLLHAHYWQWAPSPYDLTVVGQKQWLAGREASLRVVLRNEQTDRPVSGVPVQIDLLEQPPQGDPRLIHLAEFTTDAMGSGSPRFRVPQGTDCQYELQVQAQLGTTVESLRRPLIVKRPLRLLLCTDKPAYRPGETVHMRLLAMAGSGGKPLAGEKLEFTVSNPQGNVLFRRAAATSRYGIAAADCPLIEESPAGMYQLRGQLGEASAAAVVEVKPYVPPKFTVAIDFDHPFYQPGETIRGTIRAVYRYGKPVSDARTVLRIETAEVVSRTVDEISLHTGPNGSVPFQCAMQVESGSPDLEAAELPLRLSATVCDAADEKHTASEQRMVTTQPIRVEVLPEAGTLVAGVPNRVYLLTTYPDGQPAQTKIAISGVEQELATNELGVAVWEGTAPVGQLSWALRAIDKENHIGRSSVVLRCGDAPADFLLRTDKAVYACSQKLKISMLARGDEPLLVDVLRDGQTIFTGFLVPNHDRGEMQYDLPADVVGTLRISASRRNPDGTTLHKMRTIYVRPAGILHLHAATDQKRYRPGDRARLQFAVTDEKGKPTPGAIGFVAADETLAGQLDVRQRTPTQYFTLDPSLLRQVRAVYPWSPEMTFTAGDSQREEFEQALFSRTATSDPGLESLIGKLLSKYADGGRDILQVLQLPNWESVARQQRLPEEFIRLLAGEAGVYDLKVHSFPAKAYVVRNQRAARLELIREAWIILALTAAFTLGAMLLRLNPLGCLLALLALGCLAYFLYGSRTSRWNAAQSAISINALRQLGTILEAAKNNGDLAAYKPSAEPPALPQRQWLGQQTLWQAEAITDDAGRAGLAVKLTDSPTPQRLAANVVSAAGQWGAADLSLPVAQPYALDVEGPAVVAYGDEVVVPLTVSNCLPSAQEVRLTLDESPGWECLDRRERTLDLAALEVQSASFRLRARRAGKFPLHWEAQAADIRLPIQQPVEIVPGGKYHDRTDSGTLRQTAESTWHIPARTVPGSLQATVRIYPSAISQLVQRIQTHRPPPMVGCEQSVAMLYPPAAVLQYLARQHLSQPDVECRARGQLEREYQRLVTFEVAGGGFDWFGQAPADPLLSAYGLAALEELAQVYNVDPQLIERTRRWLLSQAQGGVWSLNSPWEIDPADRQLGDRVATAYIARAVFAGHSTDPRAATTAAYLHRAAERIEDPYGLALVADALLALDPSGGLAGGPLDRLEKMAQRSADATEVWWEPPAGHRALLPGCGRDGKLEATAAAVLALRHGKHSAATIAAAVAWIARCTAGEPDGSAALAGIGGLKALAEAAEPAISPRRQHVQIMLDGRPLHTLDIPADRRWLPQEVDLSDVVGEGAYRLGVVAREDAGSTYRLTVGYHTAESPATSNETPLRIALRCEQAHLAVGQRTIVQAVVSNQMPLAASLVIAELPIPAGTAAETDTLEEQLHSGKISAFQVTAGKIIVGLRNLPTEQPCRLSYILRGVVPAKIAAPLARAYEYHDPAAQVITRGTAMEVTAKPQ